MTAALSRRRFIAVSAAAAVFGGAASAAAGTRPYRWRGRALGAEAELVLRHPDHEAAATLVTEVMAEVRRLENVFSLYRPESALVRLNRAGRLAAPPPELVMLLSQGAAIAEATGGAFETRRCSRCGA